MDIAEKTFNVGFTGAIMTLAYGRTFILEAFYLFKCISKVSLQRLRLPTSSDVKPKHLAFS